MRWTRSRSRASVSCSVGVRTIPSIRRRLIASDYFCGAPRYQGGQVLDDTVFASYSCAASKSDTDKLLNARICRGRPLHIVDPDTTEINVIASRNLYDMPGSDS